MSLAWALIVMPLTCGYAYYTYQPPPETVGASSAINFESLYVEKGASLIARGLDYGIELPEVEFIDTASLHHDVVVQGSDYGETDITNNLQQFLRTVARIEGEGLRVGVVIHDLDSGAELAYNDEDVFYPASSIKALYITAVYERIVERDLATPKELAGLVEPTLIASDNDTYRELRDLCGSDVFADWAVTCGAIEKGSPQYSDFLEWYYPRITTRQLAQMWERTYDYLQGSNDAAQQLAEFFQRSEESPLRTGIGNTDMTMTKAGWYPEEDGLNSAPSTCDAGIVYHDDHCYVVAIMTDIPSDLDRLTELVPGLYSGREAL